MIEVNFHDSDEIFKLVPADLPILVGICSDKGFENHRVVKVGYFFERFFEAFEINDEVVFILNIFKYEDDLVLLLLENQI